MKANEFITEKWSQKYKNSINCSHPKGFSQRAHCAGKKKHNKDITMEQVCPDCGMCQTHGNLTEIRKGQKDSNGYTRCWPGKHAEGTKKGKNGGRVRNCVPNEGVEEAVLAQAGVVDPKIQFLQPTIQFAERHGYKVKINPNPNGKLFAKLVNKQIAHTVRIGFSRDRAPGANLEAEMTDDWDHQTWAWSARELAQDFKEFYQDALRNSPVQGQQGVAEEKADQVVKIFKDKSGKPIGEIGIDGEASPGNGNWYVAYHVTGYDAGGFDSYKEALDEFKAIAQEDGFKFYESQGVAEDAELAEEFDLIERIIDNLANHNGVDAEMIWEDLESLDDDELYVFATTTTIMETEAWQKANNRDRTDGMSRKAVKTYRREHPGSKLQTAVTTKPSKLKKGSKASKRRKSYCSRSRGQMKMHNISCAKTPDKAICKARRRWNC